MNTLLQPILKHPEAPTLIRFLQTQLEEEVQRRLVFRDWIDDSQKAEFINGEVIMHSPVKRRHWKTSSLLSTLLTVYTNFHDIGSVGVEKVMISLTRNDYEPDICFFQKEKAQYFTEDQMLFPEPDFVVEILSKRTSKTDRTTKKQDYAAHGVREYWIIDPIKQCVEQHLLITEHDKEYFPPYIYSNIDEIESRIIKGFKIPVLAIFDTKSNTETLQKLLKSEI